MRHFYLAFPIQDSLRRLNPARVARLFESDAKCRVMMNAIGEMLVEKFK